MFICCPSCQPIAASAEPKLILIDLLRILSYLFMRLTKRRHVQVVKELLPTEKMTTDKKERKRIWVDGCFDGFHFGHSNALRQVSCLGKVEETSAVVRERDNQDEKRVEK